jgi:acetoin utilization deacetylase AcuC-like enzyme
MDPLAMLEVGDECFMKISTIARDVAEKHCKGKIIASLEGGYYLKAIGNNVRDHIQILLE